MPEAAVWLIIAAPLAAAVFNGLIIRPLRGPVSRVAFDATVGAIGLSFILSLWALYAVWTDQEVVLPLHEIIRVDEFSLRIGLLLDGLTAIMLVVVTSVSLLVQIYSHGYMRDDRSYVRYYTFMALFTAAMLTLVLANNLILLFVGWELVGLCSYLLIGFWFTRPSAAAAAKKAFIITRFGDLFFLLAILGIFLLWPDDQPVTFALSAPNASMDLLSAGGAALTGTGLTLICLGIMAGAAGKSAQFPLHTWLPDAMEGPTPVSALIHAATMVAAGVFLVARFLPLFEEAETARTIVALIGGFTVVFAASMGLVMNDIKRVLAYSTVSQLGYMFLALGLGALGPALFHLFNHAFFKALLFLGSGSVNHATGTFDMRLMGGLRRVMPWTYGVFLIGSLSLAGIPPFSGFWSKDEILGIAWSYEGALGMILFVLAIVGAFMTAAYIFRALYMTFHGQYRGGEVQEADGSADAHETHDEGHGATPHESPWVMVIPMAILAVLAIGSWFINFPVTHWFTDLLKPLGAHVEEIQVIPAAIGLVAGLLGISVVTVLYRGGRTSAPSVSGPLAPIANLITRKYYMDELYENLFVGKALYGWMWRFLAWFDSDKGVVDRAVNTLGLVGRNVGKGIRVVENGQLQTSITVLSIGAVIIIAAYIAWGGVG